MIRIYKDMDNGSGIKNLFTMSESIGKFLR